MAAQSCPGLKRGRTLKCQNEARDRCTDPAGIRKSLGGDNTSDLPEGILPKGFQLPNFQNTVLTKQKC